MKCKLLVAEDELIERKVLCRTRRERVEQHDPAQQGEQSACGLAPVSARRPPPPA